MIGRTLSHYRIVERLGAGGMGEVYRAHDERLDRDVALKVLPAGALSDEEARGRFRKEAHALSRLSHPHIATIHDFDTADGIDFLVMELVRGPSLHDELEAKGPLPEKTVVRLGTQIARGLQAAHEQGVIHRDLKPANLQLTPDGLVKILDFGLARLVATESLATGATEPTQTAVGRVAGTLPYMSPEQLRGRGVDARSDLYATGAVLYELATGRRLFSKPSTAELTEAILNEDPAPPRQVNERISPGLEAVILKALDKDPELRCQTAKDLLVDLERLQVRSESRSSGSGPVASPLIEASSARTRRRWVVGVAALIVMLAGGAWLLRPPGPPRITETRPLRLDVGPDFGWWSGPTWTTDGVRLYYVTHVEGRSRLNHVALSGGEPAEIPTPFDQGLVLYGYLRRHSALIAVAPPRDSGLAPQPVWLVPLPAGAPRRLGNLVANAVAVSPDEKRLALTMYDGQGAQTRILFYGLDDPNAPPLAELKLPRSGGSWARWSPDGERLRFTAPGPPGHDPESWVWETSRTAETPRPLWPGSGGDWSSDGRYFVFERWDALALRSEIHAARERWWLPGGRAHPVRLTSGPVSFSRVGVRPDGRGLLAYGTIPRGELQRFDRGKQGFERLLGGESVGMVRASPDGQWLAWVTFPEGALWRGRRDGSERLRLTSSPERAWLPSWSPDGKRIAFLGDHPGDAGRSIRLVSADGGAVEILARPDAGSLWDPCWLPDGRSLVFSDLSFLPDRGIRRLDLTTRAITPFDGTRGLLYPKCGPQGQLLATRPAGVGDRSRPSALMLYTPAREAWEEIGPFGLNYPTWTRDGRSFCFHDPQANRVACYSFATRRVETLAEIGDNPLLSWVNVPWFGLDADDSPLLMFDRSSRDLYALDWEAP